MSPQDMPTPAQALLLERVELAAIPGRDRMSGDRFGGAPSMLPPHARTRDTCLARDWVAYRHESRGFVIGLTPAGQEALARFRRRAARRAEAGQ